VLLVEDNAAALRGYSAYLTGCGYEVTEAATGEAALEEMTRVQPHVMVLDLGLPDIDGWEVARRVKANPRTAGTWIIALTGADLPHERASSMRSGCDWHLAKPCAPADLVSLIERCVRDSLPKP
jgi:two-component system CheB/CheR fusion protein